MASSLRNVERVYSHYAGIYDRLFGRVFQAGRETVVRSLDIRPGERVLEVGVGTGLCLPLFPHHCSLAAVDLSQGMLDKARERVRRLGLEHVALARMDAGRMAFPDNSFDLVFAAYVITAVPDYREVMQEITRVSRSGARIVLLNHFTNGSRLIAACERVVSPLCRHVGFRTDLSVADVLDGWPLVLERDERVQPLQMWHRVECINAKRPAAPPSA
jgi:phosphatidylethanolamine/phosphatidyl-N-methylethanolamine N-methyltransferase